MLSIVNCLAVVYIYNQFSSLRKTGSKYLLGKISTSSHVSWLGQECEDVLGVCCVSIQALLASSPSSQALCLEALWSTSLIAKCLDSSMWDGIVIWVIRVTISPLLSLTTILQSGDLSHLFSKIMIV